MSVTPGSRFVGKNESLQKAEWGIGIDGEIWRLSRCQDSLKLQANTISGLMKNRLPKSLGPGAELLCDTVSITRGKRGKARW